MPSLAARPLRSWIVPAARFGYAAKGAVYVAVGMLAARAALAANPGEARGLGGALGALRRQAYGPWLLGAVGLGLAAYGAFAFVNARYRRIG